MKKFLKSTVAHMLGFFARVVIRRYAPRIVMVTGSVGKTSTKDAVAAALTAGFLVRKSEKSFNSEFGVPFTILGVGNPWKNPLAWLLLVKRILALLVLPNHYPNMLVLEVGSGKPGDIKEILKIVTPNAVVVTRLPEISVHVEAYSSPEAVQEEEFSPAYALRPASPLIVPDDDPYALDNAVRTGAQIFSYGLTPNATVRITDVGYEERGGKVSGMRANIGTIGAAQSLSVRGSVGTTQLLPLSAAIATALAFQISLPDALKALESYEAPPGRARLLRGRNDSIIIDDSYNSSPVAVEEALGTLKSFPSAKRRIAVLGDMLELGRYSVMEHERIAVHASESADIIASVGIRARAFTAAPGKAEALQFTDSNTAAEELVKIVREGDVILVKGSQSIRTERIVEALLADPADAVKLVRQEKEWKKKL